MTQPLQPVYEDKDGVHRFKSNKIVEHLLEFGQQHGCGLNELACIKFNQEDKEQFAQLIGYSVSGFGDLSYVSQSTLRLADKASDTLLESDSTKEILMTDADRILELEAMVKEMREALAIAVAKIFSIHPDDLLG